MRSLPRWKPYNAADFTTSTTGKVQLSKGWDSGSDKSFNVIGPETSRHHQRDAHCSHCHSQYYTQTMPPRSQYIDQDQKMKCPYPLCLQFCDFRACFKLQEIGRLRRRWESHAAVVSDHFRKIDISIWHVVEGLTFTTTIEKVPRIRNQNLNDQQSGWPSNKLYRTLPLRNHCFNTPNGNWWKIEEKCPFRLYLSQQNYENDLYWRKSCLHLTAEFIR